MREIIRLAKTCVKDFSAMVTVLAFAAVFLFMPATACWNGEWAVGLLILVVEVMCTGWLVRTFPDILDEDETED